MTLGISYLSVGFSVRGRGPTVLGGSDCTEKIVFRRKLTKGVGLLLSLQLPLSRLGCPLTNSVLIFFLFFIYLPLHSFVSV